MLPKDDIPNYKVDNSASSNVTQAELKPVTNLSPLVRGSLAKFKLEKIKPPSEPYQDVVKLFNSGDLNPEDWQEVKTVQDMIDTDMSCKLSKVKDPFIKKVRNDLDQGIITADAANTILQTYRTKRLNQKASDVLASTESSLIEQLDELAILDESDKKALELILKIIASDLSLKEQLLGVVSLISNRDIQIVLYILIIDPNLIIDILENLTNAISRLVLKIFIKLIKYIIKKLKSALSPW